MNPLGRYEIINVVDNTNERKLREELKIIKERKKGLNNLMNIKQNFENEEIIYHLKKNKK